jgi:putative peptidoglycan lipid II flippase
MLVGPVTLQVPGGHFRDETRLMLQLARLMFPYLLSICLAAIFMGMLNARGKFFIPAMGATVLNVILIGTVLWIAPRYGNEMRDHVFALAVGVLVAGAAQAAYQLPSLIKEGFRYEWVRPWKDPTVREVVAKMIPGMMGVAAFQLNVVITQSMAFAVDSQIVASFDYAVRLMELPQGVFGISLATYLLPTLSGLAAEKKFPEFRSTLRDGMGYLCFANLPATVSLIILSKPIVRLIYEHGNFGATATDRVSFALACLAPGLIAFSLVNILARAFYALGDVKSPMRISTVCLAINVVLAFFFIRFFRQGGLGIANTLSACVNVMLLTYALTRKLKTLELHHLRDRVLKMIAATAIAAIVAWGSHILCETRLNHVSLIERALAVFIPLGLAGLVYFAIALWVKIPEAHDYWQLIRQKLTKKAV